MSIISTDIHQKTKKRLTHRRLVPTRNGFLRKMGILKGMIVVLTPEQEGMLNGMIEQEGMLLEQKGMS
jgi:hypothetical protein